MNRRTMELPAWTLFYSRAREFAERVNASVEFDLRRMTNPPDRDEDPEPPHFGPPAETDPAALVADGGHHQPRYTGHWRRTAQAGFGLNEIMASNRLVPVPDAVCVHLN